MAQLMAGAAFALPTLRQRPAAPVPLAVPRAASRLSSGTASRHVRAVTATCFGALGSLGVTFARAARRPGAAGRRRQPRARARLLGPRAAAGVLASTAARTGRRAPVRGSSFRFERHDETADPSLPRLLYLPGLDGVGAYTADFEFDGELAACYDVWRLRIDGEDRSPFAVLVDGVCDFVAAGPPGLTLFGESFGALLALAVAVRLEEAAAKGPDADGGEAAAAVTPRLRGVLVVNSATAFRRSRPLPTQALGPLAEALPLPLYQAAAKGALPLGFLDAQTVAGYLAQLGANPGGAGRQIAGTAGLLDQLVGELPPRTLRFRLGFWLGEGCSQVRDVDLRRLRTPVLAVGGGQDALLPSAAEAERLAGLLRTAEARILPTAGHALFFPYGRALDQLLSPGRAPSVPRLHELLAEAPWNRGRGTKTSRALPPKLRDLQRREGPRSRCGPVEFVPYQAAGDAGDAQQRRPCLFFLHGLAGTGEASAAAQFPSLAASFRCFRCEVRDATASFATLADSVAEGIAEVLRSQGAAPPPPGVLLLGESFGGLLAVAVALRLQGSGTECQGLVLVNPATAYVDSDAAGLGPIIEAVPEAAFPGVVRAFFLGTSLDGYQLQQLFLRLWGSQAPDGAMDFGAWQPAANLIGFVARTLSPEQDALGLSKAELTLRLRWLREGNLEVNGRLETLRTPVLVVCGAADRLQPSKQEAARLERLLPDCVAVVLEDRGHALLSDGRLSIARLLELSPRFRRHLTGRAPPDPIRDFRMPTPEAFAEAQQLTKAFEAAVAPVWLSTDAQTGAVVEGLAPLRPLLQPGPPLGQEAMHGKAWGKRPVLLVGYHQRYAIDVALLVSKLYEELGVLVRGLAHPEIMNDGTMQNLLTQIGRWTEIGLVGGHGAPPKEPAQKNTGLGEDHDQDREQRDAERRELDAAVNNQFIKFGALPVSGRNFVRLLKAGENILLFPGGVREAFHRKGEEHRLFWPAEAEFVRAAARFDAVIVPFAGVGAAESFPLVLDQDELEQLPVVGENLKQAIRGRSVVREGERFSAPVGVPLPPERFYFLFGRPLDLQGVDHRDRDLCASMYERVQQEVKDAITFLLDWRQQDPHRGALSRWAWQARRAGELVPVPPLPGRSLQGRDGSQ